MSDLLTLKAASQALGVHPVTLRRWSESGKIQAVRTPGGHRRFPAAEVERLKKGDERPARPLDKAFRDRALSTTREDLKHVHADWAKTVSEEEREEKRMLGRRLVGLLEQFVVEPEEAGSEIMQEARVVARVYARGVVAAGVPLDDALRATHFFKDHILESAVVQSPAGGADPGYRQRVFRRLNEFLNEIQIVVANAYKES